MDSQDSLTLGDDFSLLAAQGMRQSMDNQTLAAPPAPLAASTVLRTQHRLKQPAVDDDPRGSFLTSADSSPRAVPRDGCPLSQMKLSFGGLDQSVQNEREGFTKESVNLIEFSKTKDVIDRDEDSDENIGNLSARSSLGILPPEALNDLSASLLPMSFSKSKNDKPSIPPSRSFKDSVDSSDWRDQSKQDSKDQPIGISHVVDTVKKRPTGRSEIAPQRHQGQGGTNMCLFGGGALTDVTETSELEQSVVDVQFEDEELKMLDEDFSDIEVSDLSDEDNENKKPSVFGQTDLSDFLEMERKVNEESRGMEDDEHGQGEGQESEDDERPAASAVSSQEVSTAGVLDMKYFRPSPMPSSHKGSGVNRQQSSFRGKTSGLVKGDAGSPGLNLSQLRRQFCTGDGSEIDTEDELEAARQTLAQDTEETSSGRATPRPNLEGQQNDASHFSMFLRQSAEGDVVTSPVPGDGGGGGDGSSGSETDGQVGSRQQCPQPHRFAHGQSYPKDFDAEAMPEEPRVRPMGDDLLSRDEFASMSGDNSVAGIDRFAAMDDGQNYLASTMRSDMEDSRLQSRFLAPVGQSLHFGDSVTSQIVPVNTSSFNIEDMFKPGKANSSQDSGINTAGNHGQGPRLDASGFNADDFPETKDPFAAFDSSFGSFGLNNSKGHAGGVSPPYQQEKADHQSVASSGLGQSFETAVDQHSVTNTVAVSNQDNEMAGPVQKGLETDKSQDAEQRQGSVKDDVQQSSAATAAKQDIHVYYDAYGEGVTDLAFQRSLAKEACEQKQFLKADDTKSDMPLEVVETDQFFDEGLGKAMLDADEEEFEKENIFMQDDKMAQSQYRDVITHSMSCWDSFASDAYMRISIGQYWATRTEDLGTLEGDPMLPRPEFGMLVRTPPGNRKPVALIEASPTRPTDKRTAGVGNEDEGDRTLLNDRDSTFTMEEMASGHQPQSSKQSSPRVQFKQPQSVKKGKQISASNERLSGSSGHSSGESDHSMTDNSGILTVSAIDSFINKVTTQSHPGELANTLMKMSNKNRQKEKKLLSRDKENKMEVESVEKKLLDQERAERKVEEKKERSDNTVFSDIRQLQDKTSSPSKKPLRGSRLPIRKGSLASTYEKAWKERQNADKQDKAEEQVKAPRRRSDIVHRPKHDAFNKNEEVLSKDRNVTKLKGELIGMRKCKSSSVLEKPKQQVTDVTFTSAKEMQKSTGHIKTDTQIKSKPANASHRGEGSVQSKTHTPEKLNNSLGSDQNDSFQGDDWMMPRPSLGGDFLDEHLSSQLKGSTQQNLLASYNNVTKLGEKENMTDFSKMYSDKSEGVENDVDIAGLRDAIMKERMKDQQEVIPVSSVGHSGQRPGSEHCISSSNPQLNLRGFNCGLSEDIPYGSQTDDEYSGNYSKQTNITVGGKKTQMYTPNVPFTSDKVDSGYGVSNVHHVPDGSEYSTVSNYLSSDKKMSRDGMVGTSDIQLAESRGFNVIGRSDHLSQNPPRSYNSTYTNSGTSGYLDSRDIQAHRHHDQGYGINSPPGKVPSSVAYVNNNDVTNSVPQQNPNQSQMRHLNNENRNLYMESAVSEGYCPEMPPPDKIPFRKPTLLTDQSLMKTEFAQKFLGKENQSNRHAVDDISFMTDDTAAQSFMELEPQNLSTMSQVYGGEVPSFYNQMPTYHSTPFNNANMPAYLGTNTCVTPANLSTIPSTGPRDGRYRTADSMLGSHLGNPNDGSMSSTMMTPRVAPASIEAPSIITFPDPCCVGISLETTLPLKNPTLRWLQCVLFVRELSLNGRSVDPETHCPFKMKTKLTVEPDATENVNLMFLPKSPGAYVAQVGISCQPFLRDENMIPNDFPTTVTLQAIAERPMIQVVTEDEGAINFGVITWGKSKVSTLSLRNVGKSMVPLRLAITASKSWHCFMFDKALGDVSLISKSNRPPSQALGKSVINICLKGYNSDSSMSAEDIKIYCRPPEKHGKLSQYPPDEIEARIDVEVDTPIASLPPVASIRLQATIGVLRLHTNCVNMETIFLKCPAGKRAEESIKLKNSGNIKMELQLCIPKFSDVFRVKPEKLFIPPGSCSSVSVIFEPKVEKDTKKYDTIFVMYVVQDGTMYELDLKGEVQLPAPKGFLLSDKSYLAFGGVALGRAKQQKVTILNNAPQSLKLSVDIRSESKCFQLQSTLSRPEEKIQRRDIIIQAQEKFPIYVLYAPDSVTASSGKLVFKPYDHGTKFSIPLSGYGGVSSLVLEGVNQSGTDKYFISVGNISVGNNCLNRIIVSNTGHRAAFIRATPYEDLHCSKSLTPGRIAIDPNEFVLLPREQKTVMVAFSPSNREVALCSEHKEIVAAVAFYHGDEVSRQKYRRSLRRERLSKPLKSLENNPVKDVNFDVRYMDEENAVVLHEGKGIQDSPSDIQHFYNSISKTTLALIGEAASSFNSMPMQTPPQHRSRSTSDLMKNTHTGLLPVTNKSPIHVEPSRDFNSMSDLSKLLHQQSETNRVVNKDDDWEIQPDQIILTLPPRGEKNVTRSFQILNFARRKLNFDLCWPGHCVHVSPKQGVVNARSTTELRVSPLPSLYDRPELLPWSGTIQVNCDNQYKLLRIQIRRDVMHDHTSDVSLSSTSLVPLPREVATPSIHVPNVSHEQNKEVQLSNTHIKFLNTRVGECCESTLELTNTANDPITWTASSFAPAYVKGVDRTSDVYRVTYAVFQLTEKSGQLKPRETVKVPVVFFPQSSGTFTQYWDVKCRIKSVVAESSLTLQVHLTGEGVEVDKDVRPEKPTNTNQSIVTSDSKSKRSSRDRRSGSRPVQLVQSMIHAECPAGQRTTVKIQFQNMSEEAHQIEVVPSQPPFFVKHKEFTIGARKMLKYPVEFKPTQSGTYDGLIVFRTDLGYSVSCQLNGHSR